MYLVEIGYQIGKEGVKKEEIPCETDNEEEIRQSEFYRIRAMKYSMKVSEARKALDKTKTVSVKILRKINSL